MPDQHTGLDKPNSAKFWAKLFQQFGVQLSPKMAS